MLKYQTFYYIIWFIVYIYRPKFFGGKGGDFCEKNIGGALLRGDLNWECGGILLKIVISLPRIYEKLHYCGETYRFCGLRDPSLQKDIDPSCIFKSFSGEPDLGEPNRSG